MKIAIIGTKGIPNIYGGFEQFAERVSVGLTEKGFQVIVYNPHFHPYSQNHFHGVRIIRKLSPEKWIGAALANILYDYLCLRDALKQGCDTIYEAGYHSAVPSFYLCNLDQAIVVTNMDGLEWKRSKWGGG